MANTGTIYSSLGDAINEMFTVTGHTFFWKGQPYPCALNVEAATITTSKDKFPGGLPKVGDRVTIVGNNYTKDFSITAISGGSATFVPGGYVESSTPFMDDSMSPVFTIHYGAFVRG